MIVVIHPPSCLCTAQLFDHDLIFSVQLLKKQTLDPEIMLLYLFHGQKALFKVSKICSTNFGIGNSPSRSPLELFSKIIRFGTNI